MGFFEQAGYQCDCRRQPVRVVDEERGVEDVPHSGRSQLARSSFANASASSAFIQPGLPIIAPAVSSKTLRWRSRRTCFAMSEAMYGLRPRGPTTLSI